MRSASRSPAVAAVVTFSAHVYRLQCSRSTALGVR